VLRFILFLHDNEATKCACYEGKAPADTKDGELKRILQNLRDAIVLLTVRQETKCQIYPVGRKKGTQ